MALDLDVRFIHPPTLTHRALLPCAESRFQLRRELLYPAVNAGMIHFDAPLRQHLFQIPIAQRVREIPTDAGQNNVLFKAVAFEINHASSQVED